MKNKLPCEGVIILQALKRRLEGLIGGEFEDDVMVLGVKPLRHFHDRDVAAAIASRHDEVGVESGAHIPKNIRNGSQCNSNSQIKKIAERKVAHSDEGKPCAMLNLPMPFFSSSTVLRSCPSESSPFQYPSRTFLSSRFRPIRGKTRMYVCIACFFLLLKLKTAVKSVNGCPAGCFLTQKFVLQSVERSATAIPQRPLSAHG